MDTSELAQNFLDDEYDPEAELERAKEIWPVCPECGARRVVECPICHQVGDLFPLADAEYWDGTDPSIKPQEVPKTGCGCGNQIEHACHCHPDDTPEEVPNTEPESQLFWGMPDLRKGLSPALKSGPSITVSNPDFVKEDKTIDLKPVGEPNRAGDIKLLLCSGCDEPFIPKFASRCVCGHRFDPPGENGNEGNESEDEQTSLDEETIRRFQNIRTEEPVNSRVAWAIAVLTALSLAGAGYLWFLFR